MAWRMGKSGMTSGTEGGGVPPPLSLDDVDRAIVTALCEDGRLSMRALAARLHISRAGAYVRVQRLEQAGVITGYTARVDPQRYGLGLSAYVYLNIAQPAWRGLLTRLIAIQEVEHASLVSGDTDIVLLVRTRDVATLRELVLNRFQSMPEVQSTQTVLIFDELGHVPPPLGPTAPAPSGGALPGAVPPGAVPAGAPGHAPTAAGPTGTAAGPTATAAGPTGTAEGPTGT